MVERSNASVEEGIQDGAARKTGNEAGEDLILGKFKSQDDLANAYKELEKKLGARAVPPKADEEGLPERKPEPEENWQVEPQEGADEAPMLPGLQNNVIEEISNYAWEHGALDDKHYDTLAQAGYSREMVDSYMAGQFAQVEASTSQLINAGGGQEKVQAMFQWAEQALTQDQIDQYNERFDRGGPDAIMAMEHLAAKFDSSGGGYEARVQGANAPLNATAEPFRSVEQVKEAMSDPRYHSDPAFREEVYRRLEHSNVL